MLVDINGIKNGTLEYIDFDNVIDASNIGLKGTDIIELKELKVSGTIVRDSLDNYNIDMNIDGIMVLPCSITLEPVNYDFRTKVSGNIYEMLEEIGEFNKKSENTIDLFPIIWENILMEIPIKVVSPNALDKSISGDGWKFITDTEEVKESNAFDKLKDLL